MGLTDIDSFSRIKKFISEDGEEHIIALGPGLQIREYENFSVNSELL